MANARKDNRGYTLHSGEYQRKDGRYVYRYTDKEGKRHSVYAKTLPEIRKREREINRDLEDGINPRAAEKITLNQLFDKYISQKYDLRETTKANYIYKYNRFVRNGFGRRKIIDIRYSDVKAFYYDLLLNKTLKPNTLEGIQNTLHPSFQMAVRDEILRKNPTDGVMAEIKKGNLWERPNRRALTIPQQKAFVQFIREERKYKGWEPLLTILLGTGMRIGECLGLRWEDLDFEQRVITVSHTFTNRPTKDGCVRHISPTKTRAGVRTIPMIDEVFKAFLQEYEMQKCVGYQSETIDGYTNFVFVTSTGAIVSHSTVNRVMRDIVKDYNEKEMALAKSENREPLLIPQISPHSLRHTFCTRFCENESNMKVIQSIMGHSDIATTMDIYAEATREKKQEIMANLQGKIII